MYLPAEGRLSPNIANMLFVYYSSLSALWSPTICLPLSMTLSIRGSVFVNIACASWMMGSNPIYGYLRLAAKLLTPSYTILADGITNVITVTTGVSKAIPYSSCSNCILDISELYTLSKYSVDGGTGLVVSLSVMDVLSGGQGDALSHTVVISIVGLTATSILIR